jgi:putative peptidoglycan lipid II flippase
VTRCQLVSLREALSYGPSILLAPRLQDREFMVQETNNKPAEFSNNTVARSAFKVSLGGVFGLIARLGSQVVVAWIFGAGAEMDAFLTALVVPLYLESVLLAGLPFVLIPVFVQEETAGSEDEAWALAGTFFWLATGTLAVVAVGGSLFSPGIIALTAPGLSSAKAGLTAQMLAILMFAVPLTGLGSLTKGIQNARNRFFWPAMSSAIGSAGNVMTLLVLYPRMGPLALAWGYLVHAALGACVTVVPVVRHGWGRLIPLRDRRVHEMARLMAPFLLFGIVTHSTSVFERYFASGLPDGDLSYLGYANKISNIVMTLLGTGIATAVFPTMARAHAQNGEAGLVVKARYGFRLSLAVALPTWAILSAVPVPLITVLFERGSFQHAATLATSRIIPIVIISAVVFRMVGNLISRTFYVIKDTHTVPIVVAVTSVPYILLAKTFADTWGYVGLALAQPAYSGLGILVLSLLMIRKLRSLQAGRLLRDTLIYGGASLMAFVAARLACSALGFLPAPVQLLAASCVAGTLYLIVLFRVDREIAASILELTGVRRVAMGAKVAFRRTVEPSGGQPTRYS